MDAMLPFGLCSAPKIFTAVADGLEWILRQQGIRHIDHYLDDYVTFGPAGSPECAKALELMQQVCRELGVPLAMEKLEGPTTCLTFLGIEVDTMEGVLRLPQDKLSRLREALAKWECRMSSPPPPAAALADWEEPETAPCSYLGPLRERRNDGNVISRQPACSASLAGMPPTTEIDIGPRKKNRHLRRCIRDLSLQDLPEMVCTAAWLSHRAWTRQPCHSLPHTTPASRIANNSLKAMWCSLLAAGHLNWNQACWLHAPQPHSPDASDVTITVGRLGGGKNTTPFQWDANVDHHHKSALNSPFRRM